jgi:DnaK suppressor protein
MDKKKIEKFREQLEQRRTDLKKIVARNEQDGREADVANAQDIADRAANSYTKEFLFHQSNSERQMLQLIEGALGRLREGVFGECVNCGNEINTKRLEAVPWTRYCIECQEKLEKGQLEQVT